MPFFKELRVASCELNGGGGGADADNECGMIGQSERFKITATLIASIAFVNVLLLTDLCARRPGYFSFAKSQGQTC